jgi:hypothetical protein
MRGIKMKIFFNSMAALLCGLVIGEISKADSECRCISAHITHIVNNQVRWVGTCYSEEGDKKSVSMIFNTPEEAAKQTKRYKIQNQVEDKDCVFLPGGKMIYTP